MRAVLPVRELREQAKERRSTFIARAGPETTARIGERREIWVDTRKLYLFDPSTGNSIYRDGRLSSIDAATLTA